jgi:probable FeS assembly SUF system protein SufT
MEERERDEGEESTIMYHRNEAIILERDCDAVLIPSGEPITLKAGDPVYITQTLGNNYTVYIHGNLARIAGQDLDALGLEPIVETVRAAASADGSVDESLIWDQLRTCYDPEIPINIVDLGLIYDCSISSLAEGGNRVEIKLTLTAPGCGMGQFLVEDVKSKIEQVPNVTEVEVELVFDPPWNYDMMSEAARLQTGMY